METAERMGLDKKLKPFYVPPLAVEKEGKSSNSFKGPVVEGGYYPFSMHRADAFNYSHQVQNVWQGLLKLIDDKNLILEYLDPELMSRNEIDLKKLEGKPLKPKLQVRNSFLKKKTLMNYLKNLYYICICIFVD